MAEKSPESKLTPKEKPKFTVIGVSGQMGSGKDYVALNILKPLLGPDTLIVGLADHFKIQICAFEHVPFEKVFGDARDAETRKRLQRAGTEEGRLKIRESVWIDTLETTMRLHASRGVKNFIIVDVRNPDEAVRVKELGGYNVRLVAQGRTRARVMREAKGDEKTAKAIMSHPSEIDMENIISDPNQKVFDLIVPNDPGDEVICKRWLELFVNERILGVKEALGKKAQPLVGFVVHTGLNAPGLKYC